MLVVSPLLVALAFWIQDATFVFDAPSRTLSWTRRRLAGMKQGSIPFEDILDVKQRGSTDLSESRAHIRYRVALVTRSGDIFLSIMENPRKSADEGVVSLIRNTLS